MAKNHLFVLLDFIFENRVARSDALHGGRGRDVERVLCCEGENLARALLARANH